MSTNLDNLKKRVERKQQFYERMHEFYKANLNKLAIIGNDKVKDLADKLQDELDLRYNFTTTTQTYTDVMTERAEARFQIGFDTLCIKFLDCDKLRDSEVYSAMLKVNLEPQKNKNTILIEYRYSIENDEFVPRNQVIAYNFGYKNPGRLQSEQYSDDKLYKLLELLLTC
jgi:hypothetical protein